MRLNLGCGLDVRPGWVNVDLVAGPGVDLVADLDSGVLELADDSVTEIYGSHVVEHLLHPLVLMQQLWRVAQPGCVATFRTPYGSSDDADADPTHVRRMFPSSWGYFGQPHYWRADYGYTADWRVTRVELHLFDLTAELADADIAAAVLLQRNTVTEMVATLVAVKPARARSKEAQTVPDIVYMRPRRNDG